MPLPKMDIDIKMEIIINLAFGVPIEMIAKTYNVSESKIINLRKNNYKLYNQISEQFYISDEIAILGLSVVYERALDIVKKQYKNKLEIINPNLFMLENKRLLITDIVEMADQINARDNIPPLNTIPKIKNYYHSNKK